VRTRLQILLLLGTTLALAWAPSGAEPPGVLDAPPPFFEDALPPGPSLAERLEEIRSRVQEAVVYPPEARSRGITGVTRIRFEIAADGRAEKIRTVATSGSALLDDAAEQGAADAEALPRVYGRVEVPIRFELVRRRR
jgi:TonB family protein